MTRRGVLVGLAMLVLLGACSSESEPRPDTDEGTGDPVSITLQVSGEPEETAVFGQLADNFEKDNEGTTVEVVEIAEKDEHIARLASSFASGEPPEIFLVNFREYSQFVSQGAVEPIGPLVDERGVDLGDYYTPPVEAFSYGGQLQCFPQNISSLVVYWNRSVFEDAGVEPPAEGWTWDDFRSTAEQLSDGKIDGVGIDPEIIRLAPFVWSNGGNLVDDETAPTHFTLDEPASKEALEFLAGLQHDGLMPTAKELAAEDLETRFTTGKVGMMLESRKVVPGFREARFEWDVAPLPVAEEPATILHSDAYCISAGADEIEAAADFVAHAIGEEGQSLAALSGRTVPSLISAAESEFFLDPDEQPASSQVFLDVTPSIRFTPVIPTWVEIEDVAKGVLEKLFYEDGYTVDQAIEDLDTETRSLFEEASG
jgi:multiple sugar transport system substrate-binding protein